MVLCCGGRCSGGTANDEDKEALGCSSAQPVLASWSLWPSPGPGESIGGSVDEVCWGHRWSREWLACVIPG